MTSSEILAVVMLIVLTGVAVRTITNSFLLHNLQKRVLELEILAPSRGDNSVGSAWDAISELNQRVADLESRSPGNNVDEWS